MSKTNKNTMDMTHGTLWNKILIFALPLAASSILQQLFNSIDTQRKTEWHFPIS